MQNKSSLNPIEVKPYTSFPGPLIKLEIGRFSKGQLTCPRLWNIRITQCHKNIPSNLLTYRQSCLTLKSRGRLVVSRH